MTLACSSAQENQTQFPERPLAAMIPDIANGVSAAKVVAAMDEPAHHQGRDLSARKKLLRLLCDFLATKKPVRTTKPRNIEINVKSIVVTLVWHLLLEGCWSDVCL